MKCSSAASGLLLVALVLSGSASGLVAGNQGKAGSGTPVERVVNLLKDLKTKIGQDGKVEQLSYDKYACWCEKTTARKGAAITEAQEELRKLGQSILKLKGKVATLTAEIAELEAAIKANKEAQAEATSIRQKENAAYTAETAEMKQALAALQKAIIVLRDATAPSSSSSSSSDGTSSDGTSSSLLQEQAARSSAAVRHVIEVLPSVGGLKTDQVSLLGEFAAGGAGSKFAPQSWTVQGILKDMYDTFSSDLESTTEAEATANRNYEDFIHKKMEELAQLEATKAEKEELKAEAESQLANTVQDYDDTESQMKADIVFFDETKAACENKHSDWSERSELRKEELEGINKALEILTTDAARDLFSSAIKMGKEVRADNSYDTGMNIAGSISFVQASSSSSMAAPAEKAYAALKEQATHSRSLRLAALAAQVRLAKVGHFDKVLQAIDEMIATLKSEDTADIAKRDQCKSEYQSISSKVAEINWLIEKNEAKIDKLEKLIALRTEQRLKTIEEIKIVKQEIVEMNATRKEENDAFLFAKKEDQQAIELLMNARDVLSSYYVKNNITMGPIQGSVKDLGLVQQPEFDIDADQAPEAIFSHKGKRKNEAKGIVQIMTTIIEDLDDEIKNGMRAEEVAQLDYEKQFAAAYALQQTLIQKKADLQAMITKRGEEKTFELGLLEQNKGDLKDELDYKKSITPDCDWIIGAWKTRAEQRTSEMDGLVKAKEYLAGFASGGEAALLEKQKSGRTFDDTALSKIRFLGMKA